MGGASTGGGGGGVGPAGVRVSKKGKKTYGTAKDAKKKPQLEMKLEKQ
jgi:hypothetical protein